MGNASDDAITQLAKAVSDLQKTVADQGKRLHLVYSLAMVVVGHRWPQRAELLTGH